MIKRLTVVELARVRRLLAARWRHVQIAKELELSLWTVQRIANDPALQIDPLPESELPVDDGPPDYAAADLRRCPGCGGMVYHWPCIACRDISSPPVPPAAEVVDELVDKVGWDVVERARERRSDRETERRNESGLALWGQRTRRTKGNGAYRAKRARVRS